MNFTKSADATRWLLVFTVLLTFIICYPLRSETENDTVTAQSFSGQFLVRAPKNIPPLPAANQPTNQLKIIELNPNFLAVICERVKDNILFTLNQKDEWKGSVIIRIYSAKSYLDPVWVNAHYSDRGWIYYMDFPSHIEMNRLIRAIVEVVLQETADRKAGSKPAELPPWLPTAFTLNVHLTAPDITIMELYTKKVRVDRRTNPINLIKKHIISITPLTWDELSWPTDEEIMDNSITNRYCLCSYIFLNQILRLPDGIKKMKDFFTILPSRWNWQVAFIEAFKPHFYSMRDVEKWWSVTITSITGRTGLKTITYEESLKKLDEILNSPVKIPSGNTNTNYIVIKLPLQQVITQYSYSRHRQVLREKLGELTVLQQNIHPALTRLVEDYREAIQSYLDRRYRSNFGSELPPYTSDSPKLITKNILNRLEMLDEIRADFKQHGYDDADIPTPAFDDPLVLQNQTNKTSASPPTLPKSK